MMRAVLAMLLVVATPALGEEALAPVAPPAPTAADWGALRTPGEGPPQAIGRYGGGCLDGAARLPVRGPGFFVAHPARGRFYGHPTLVALIQHLGDKTLRAHLPALPVGDLAQVRGGPAATGHASHQTGLDVDVGYVAPGKGGEATSIVDLVHQRVSPRYAAAVARVLAMVVGAPEVDRVFVNPAIKRALCASPSKDRAWLQKVRPWWGHHDHFHVRLSCPEGSPLCEAQAPLPAGDGCGELDWWFRKNPDREEERKGYQARVGATPPLPEPCMQLVH